MDDRAWRGIGCRGLGMKQTRVRLKPGRDKSLRRGHPWIFSGAIAQASGTPQSGETVCIESAEGEALALAAWSASSQIRARVWSFATDTVIDAAFIHAQIEAAIALRTKLPELAPTHTNAQRLVHGESDGLPGLIVDRYAHIVVVQILSAGMERWREAVFDALHLQTGASVYERSDAEVRALEGLPQRVGAVRANDHMVWHAPIHEHGLQFHVDVVGGQKTGFYLDQRDNRQRIRALANGRRVLDCFCYTGGFALAAAAGDAQSVLALDSSELALHTARENAQRNACAERVTFTQADVFAQLRELRNRHERFDLIVLDPPKFAPTAAQTERAARAYKDINLLALKLLAPGGLLASFSCSGGVDAGLFQKILAGAAVDAEVDAQIIGHFAAAADHPVRLAFPEGDYLKGLLIHRP